ncbi:hypothetical protein [Roseivirga echinicomitans]|nr:hypothetical protein [Roseivirga echinicomitans]
MKINRTKTLSALVLIVMIIIGCGTVDPNGLINQELAFEKLAGDWIYGVNGQITLDGQDVSLNYPDFSISFADGTYTTINGGNLFRATGTWTWVSEVAGSINLDTGEEVTILDLSVTRFKFSFTHSGGGVVAGTSGNYTVSLEK